MTISAIAFSRDVLSLGGMTATVAPHLVALVAESFERSIRPFLYHRHSRAAHDAVRRARRCVLRLRLLQGRHASLEFCNAFRQPAQALPKRHVLQDFQDV